MGEELVETEVAALEMDVEDSPLSSALAGGILGGCRPIVFLFEWPVSSLQILCFATLNGVVCWFAIFLSCLEGKVSGATRRVQLILSGFAGVWPRSLHPNPKNALTRPQRPTFVPSVSIEKQNEMIF